MHSKKVAREESRQMESAKANKMQEEMWHVGSVLEAARKSAWYAASACEENGNPELAKKLDEIALRAGEVETQMKALYWKTFGMVRPKTYA